MLFLKIYSFLLTNCNMETCLFPLILDINFTCTLMVQKHLAQHQFNIILVHILARVRYLIITIICQVKRCTIAVARVSCSIDIATLLQVFHIILCTQYTGNIKTIMWQIITLQDISKLLTYTLQFGRSGWYEIRNRMRQRVHNIILIRLYQSELTTHFSCLLAVLWRRTQTNRFSRLLLFGLSISKLILITKRAARIRYQRRLRVELVMRYTPRIYEN